MKDYDYTYISLGAGVQSSFLAVCSVLGLHNVPRADVAIFADTQDEPKGVYAHLDRLSAWLEERGLDVQICTAGRLSESKNKHEPLYAQNEDGSRGMTTRQCTSHYKVQPIHKHVRKLLGRERKKITQRVRSLHGISYDEVHRMRDAREPWLTFEYPLVEARLTRWHCLQQWPQVCDLPLPPRSACIQCPYHSNDEWRQIRDTDTEAWQWAIAYDAQIRYIDTKGHVQYLHKSMLPLPEVDLTDPHADQYDLWGNECEGMCGV